MVDAPLPSDQTKPETVIIKSVPFFANTQDDTHCYQAAIASVLGHFQPDRSFTFGELDQMSAKKEGLWTWESQMGINLIAAGYEVVAIDDFDMPAFIQDGVGYLRRQYGDEVAEEQAEHSDIEQEQGLMAEYLKVGNHIQRAPNIEDIRSFLKKGYLVICTVNSKSLDGKEGYVGHFVVVYGIDGNCILFHDPGLPPQPNRSETLEIFNRGWASPSEAIKGLTAFKFQPKVSTPDRI
ncbi:MAG: peptidase C39 family protein [Candidatus Levybacteria bacterium]|nr:peptidase C39 family protein [Candidatus Levybacteria bacterium]